MLPSCANLSCSLNQVPVLGSAPNRHRRLPVPNLLNQRKMGTVTASGGSVSDRVAGISPKEDNAQSRRTVRELVEELKNGKNDEIPESHEVLEQLRPKLSHKDFADLPIIDLGLVHRDRVERLGQAAREWGFFQLVNHGLSVEELQEIHSQALAFFRLPAQTKLKLAKDKDFYKYDASKVKFSALHWAESLEFMYTPETKFQDTLGVYYPEGDNTLRAALIKYCDAAERINKLLLELLAEGLDLSTSFFSQHLNSRRTLALRLNYYPVCPQPSRTLGANEHTDGSSLTVLLQDKVGGLQIKRDGEWFGVKPIDGALVVNIGDALHAWSNGRYKSVLHRVLVNKDAERLSLAAFMNVDASLPLSAPDQLVDDEHPRLYKPFTFGDYLQQVLKIRTEDANGLRPMMDGHRILAGLSYK